MSGSVEYDSYGNVLSDTRKYAENDVYTQHSTHVKDMHAGVAWGGSGRPADCYSTTFVKLRELSLTYNLPQKFVKGWAKSASVSFVARTCGCGQRTSNIPILTAAFDTENTYSNGMPITEAYINGYFTGEAAYKTAPADRLKQIWFQRYFLKFLQDGYDAYSDFLRTGYPEFPLDPNTNLNTTDTSKFPVR